MLWVLSRRQLANHLDLSISRIQRLEQDETTGAVIIKSMRRTAEAMDCVFVYVVVPRASLDDVLQKQAIKKAKKYLQDANHTMALEGQALGDKPNQDMLEALAKQLIEQSKRTLWDD